MNSINEYVLLIEQLLEKPRNELIKKNNPKYDELIGKYDNELLEKYKNIEKMLEEELEES